MLLIYKYTYIYTYRYNYTYTYTLTHIHLYYIHTYIHTTHICTHTQRTYRYTYIHTLTICKKSRAHAKFRNFDIYHHIYTHILGICILHICIYTHIYKHPYIHIHTWIHPYTPVGHTQGIGISAAHGHSYMYTVYIYTYTYTSILYTLCTTSWAHARFWNFCGAQIEHGKAECLTSQICNSIYCRWISSHSSPILLGYTSTKTPWPKFRLSSTSWLNWCFLFLGGGGGGTLPLWVFFN